jgi:hypothetical protein
VGRDIKLTGQGKGMDHLMAKAVEMRLNPNNLGREGGFMLYQAQQPETNLLDQAGEASDRNQGQVQVPA